MRRIFSIVALWLAALPCLAQTSVTITTTVQNPNDPRPGINLGGGQTALSYYGPNQLFKDLNYAQGGSFPGFYWASTFQCDPGSNTVFNWSNNIPNDYPNNFWVGAEFHAISKTDGSEFGTGTVSISASGGFGTNFSLGAGISRPCSASAETPVYIPWGDVLLVRARTPGSVALAFQTPNDFYGGFPASSSWSTDVDPGSGNTIHSLKLLTGTAASFADDAVLKNATNPNATLANTYVPFINLNGNYAASYRAKCLTAGCTVTVSVARLSGTTYIPGSTVDSPTFNTTPGAGWSTFTHSFTATETGAQGSGIYYVLTCTGTCLLQDAELNEGSTLAGNTTVFRDAVVSELQKAHPGSLRYMDSSQWCADVNDEIAPIGNRRWCGVNEYVHYIQGPAIGYGEFLKLCDVVGADCWLSVGVTNQPADWQTLITWLSTSGWTATFASHGHKIYLEHGNEPWNTAAPGYMNEGNGIAYGGTLGRIMAAAKSATGYDASTIKLVGGAWTTPGQGNVAGGWTDLALQYSGCTLSARAGCPDFVDLAPYTLTYYNSSSVSPTASPFSDEWAEISNIDSVTTPPSDYLYSAGSVYFDNKFALDNYNVNSGIYETNISTVDGNLSSQVPLNQLADSVGEGLAQVQHMLLMQRDSKVIGPINFFNLAQYYFNFNSTPPPPAIGMWGSVIAMATGPGQAVNSANYERPVQMIMDVVNNAIGSNTNLMSATQSGTPTFSYPGGQPLNGYAGIKNTILANAAVPNVNCFSYADNAKVNWTEICFNNDLVNPQTVNLSGAGAPTGSVTKVLFPNAGNAITDNNEATYVGPSSLPLVVTYPSPTTTSGTSYTIPPASMIALSYAISGTPSAAVPTFSPVAGTYAGAQSVTASSATGGATICSTIDGTTPTANGAGTCTHGSTNASPISVPSSLTIKAIASKSGFLDSAVGTAAYTITPQTWWVRADGGNRYSSPNLLAGQCDGKADVSYVTASGATPGTYWYSLTVYAPGAVVYTGNGFYATTSGGGTSAATITWPSSGTVTDGSVTWVVGAAFPKNQHCAFNQARFLFQTGEYNDDGSTFPAWGWIGSGGDTYVIRGCNGDGCRFGWPANGSNCLTADGLFCYGRHGDQFSGGMPPPLSGSSGSHTKILGGNYASCSNPSSRTEIFGGWGTGQVVGLDNASYMDLGCLSITDHSACGLQNAFVACKDGGGAVISDFASQGITLTNTSTHITLTDIGIHGLAADGIHGPPGDGFTATDLQILGNQDAGWNADRGDSTTGTGATSVSNFDISWNGCAEEYPIVDSVPYFSCRDQSTGGYGDGFGTTTIPSSPGWNVSFDNGTVSYNMQDGLDGLHINGTGSTISETRILAYGNEGQQLKAGGAQTTVRNSILIGNCYAVSQNTIPGRPSPTHDSLANACRAGNVALFVTTSPGTPTRVQDNTIFTAGNIGMEFEYATGDTGSTNTLLYNNNIFVGFNNPDNSENPTPIYTTGDFSALTTNPGASWTNNSTFGARSGWSCPATGESAALCTNPLLTDMTWHPYGYGNVAPTGPSNVLLAGVPITGITTDFYGVARNVTNPTIGAIETPGSTPPSTVATPTYSPVAGPYVGQQTITVSTVTGGASIIDTVDGSDPTVNPLTCTIVHGNPYSGPVTIFTSTTFKAIGCLSGSNASTIATAAYTLTGSTPSFSPNGGSFSTPQTVSISATYGTIICWNTTGAPATNHLSGCTNGTRYFGPITVPNSETVYAVAGGGGYVDSAVGSAVYVISGSGTSIGGNIVLGGNIVIK